MPPRPLFGPSPPPRSFPLHPNPILTNPPPPRINNQAHLTTGPNPQSQPLHRPRPEFTQSYKGKATQVHFPAKPRALEEQLCAFLLSQCMPRLGGAGPGAHVRQWPCGLRVQKKVVCTAMWRRRATFFCLVTVRASSGSGCGSSVAQ